MMSKILESIWNALKDKFSTRKADYLLCDVKYKVDQGNKNITLTFKIYDKTWITQTEILRGIRDAIDKKIKRTENKEQKTTKDTKQF